MNHRPDGPALWIDLLWIDLFWIDLLRNEMLWIDLLWIDLLWNEMANQRLLERTNTRSVCEVTQILSTTAA